MNRFQFPLAYLFAIALGSLSPVVAASEAAPEWTFGGFGSLGAAHSSERQADYTANVVNPGTAGFSDRWSMAVDSRLGAQLGLTLDTRWSGVLQVVAERNLQNSYKPVVEWANINYQATRDLSLRVGRIALPIYLAGDYRKAGYALQWARPPAEVYGALPISNSDGIDVSYRWREGASNNLTQFFYGRTAIKLGASSRAFARHLAGLSNTTTHGPFTVRASALTAELSVDLARPLFDAFRQFGPQGELLAEKYDVDHKSVVVANIGVGYDNGRWFVMSEASRLNARSFLGDKTSMYATGGYRLGEWTPYLTYAASRSNDPTHENGLNLAYLPPQAAPSAAYLNGQLNNLLSSITVQHTVSAGVRWDFLPDRALKLQYDHLRPSGGSSGTLINVQPGFRSGHAVHVVSAVLDFVF